MAITNKRRRHKSMERVLRSLMGNNLPANFKFKDTYTSIRVPRLLSNIFQLNRK